MQKIYFQPDVNLDLAIAQIVSATNSVRTVLPPGIQAPIVMSYNASSVPVLQLSLKSDRHSEQQLYEVEDKIREVIPQRDRDLIVDDIGVPQQPYNLAFTDGSTINANDGVILVSLKEGHAPTATYVRKLREVLPAAFPSATFYFQAADMITQVLNFGLPLQIDVQVVGRDRGNNRRVAEELRRRLADTSGIADAHRQQELDAPAFMVDIDRSRALQLGLSAQAIANDVTTSLSSSEQVAPNFWTDPVSGIPYYIAVQTPERLVSSLNEIGDRADAAARFFVDVRKSRI